MDHLYNIHFDHIREFRVHSGAYQVWRSSSWSLDNFRRKHGKAKREGSTDRACPRLKVVQRTTTEDHAHPWNSNRVNELRRLNRGWHTADHDHDHPQNPTMVTQLKHGQQRAVRGRHPSHFLSIFELNHCRLIQFVFKAYKGILRKITPKLPKHIFFLFYT